MVNAVLDDHRTAPIADKDRALFDFLEKMNRASTSITMNDLDRLRDLGWTDEAMYDAITVCALFNFFNKWIDATGVQDMPPASYEAAGVRMKDSGYVPE